MRRTNPLLKALIPPIRPIEIFLFSLPLLGIAGWTLIAAAGVMSHYGRVIYLMVFQSIAFWAIPAMVVITLLMAVITTSTCHTTLRRIGPLDIVRQIPLTDRAIARTLLIETVYRQRYILSFWAGGLLGLTILEAFLPYLWNFVRDGITGTDPSGPRTFTAHEYLQHSLFWLTVNTGIWLLSLTACAVGVLSAVAQKSTLFAPLMATFITMASVIGVNLAFFGSLRYKIDFRTPALWSISAACIACPGLALLLISIFGILTARMLARH